MELWVRSQNKCKLRKTDLINYTYEAGKHIIDCHGYPVGTYASKKRCLEIIDEIQKILSHNGMMLFKNVDISEIPKEAFEPFKALSYLPYNDKNSEVTVHNAEVVVYEMPSE